MVEMLSLLLVIITILDYVAGFCPLDCDCKGWDQLEVECRNATIEVNNFFINIYFFS